MNRENKVLINGGGVAEVADYKEQVVEEYKNNPFIEALPNIMSNEEAIDKLAVYPYYNSDERSLEAHYRYHLIQRLFQYLQPINTTLDLESRISRVIRQGYIARSPFKIEYANAFQEGYKMILNKDIELINNELYRTTASGFSIIGVSGIGKSVSLNKVLSLIPQCIVHSEYKGNKLSMYQVTWIKLDCPFDGSIKGLCLDFFSKVDSLLGTRHYKKYGTGRQSVNVLMPILTQVARNINLGMIIIDEIQHLSLARSGGSEKMLNFFTTLINMASVPVITIATPKALPILQSQFRQARRGSGQGDMIWNRLETGDSWDLILEGIWDYQWTRKVTPLTKELKDVIYEESQGITDIAIKLYAMAQISAISSGKEEVTTNTIRKVAEENLRLVRPMIQALKSGNLSEIAKIEDICIVNIDSFLNQELSKISLNNKIKELQDAKKQSEASVKENIKEQVILKLIDFDVNPKQAKVFVEEVIEKQGLEIGINEIVKQAYKLNLELDSLKKEKRRAKAKDNVKDEKDFRVIVMEGKKNGMSAHEALKQKGFIKEVDNDFFQVV